MVKIPYSEKKGPEEEKKLHFFGLSYIING